MDKRTRASPSDVKPGDQVLLQQAKQNKLSTRYDPKPYTVLERKGTSLILQRGNGPLCMRNVSRVRKLHQTTALQEEDDLDMEMNLPLINGDPLQNNGDPLQAENQCVRKSVRVRHTPAHLNDYQL